jgi:hypothetical protein
MHKTSSSETCAACHPGHSHLLAPIPSPSRRVSPHPLSRCPAVTRPPPPPAVLTRDRHPETGLVQIVHVPRLLHRLRAAAAATARVLQGTKGSATPMRRNPCRRTTEGMILYSLPHSCTIVRRPCQLTASDGRAPAAAAARPPPARRAARQPRARR